MSKGFSYLKEVIDKEVYSDKEIFYRMLGNPYPFYGSNLKIVRRKDSTDVYKENKRFRALANLANAHFHACKDFLLEKKRIQDVIENAKYSTNENWAEIYLEQIGFENNHQVEEFEYSPSIVV